MALERAHPGAVRAAHVVHAQHVQTAVDEQRLELARERDAAPARLTPGGVERDDHVAEHAARVAGAGTFGERERQHVGGAGAPAVTRGQGRDLGVVHERHGQLGVSRAQDA
jgi:hypothetical protein